MSSLAVIIITRDREEELGNCLRSILQQTRRPDEIIVVDDASRVPQSQFVERIASDATVVRNDVAQGVPGARNVGIQRSRADYLVFIDDDAVFGNRFVLEHVENLLDSNPGIGILAFKIVNADTGCVTPHEFPHTDLGKASEQFETSYFVGAGHAIRRKVFEEVGLLYSPYFYGLEESDFSWRAIQAGYSIIYDPRLLVYHWASPKARPSWRKVYFQTRNRVWFVVSFLPLRFILTHLLVWMPYFLVASLRVGRPDVFFKALYDAIGRLPKMRKRRKTERLTPATIQKITSLNGRLLY